MVARDIFNNPSDFLGELPKQIWEAGNNGGCQNTACTITATRAAPPGAAGAHATGVQERSSSGTISRAIRAASRGRRADDQELREEQPKGVSHFDS